jgi:tetratricopeptide (TPR) repeat protein
LQAFSTIVLAWIAFAGVTIAHAPQQPQDLAQLLAEGRRLLQSGDLEASRHCLEQAIELARRDKDALSEGQARHELARISMRKADYPAAQEALSAALPLFESAADPSAAARVLMDLGYVAWMMGDNKKAAPFYREALRRFEEAEDLEGQAATIYSLAFAAGPGEERAALLQRGLRFSRDTGNRRLEGRLFHMWADEEFARGNFAAAGERLELAAELLRGSGTGADLARVYTPSDSGASTTPWPPQTTL